MNKLEGPLMCNYYSSSDFNLFINIIMQTFHHLTDDYFFL